MGVFRRRYPDGRVSKDWYIDYRINGRRFKRRIGPNKKVAEQVLMDVEVKKAKGDYLGIYAAKSLVNQSMDFSPSPAPFNKATLACKF
jgi:hypothetical protein